MKLRLLLGAASIAALAFAATGDAATTTTTFQVSATVLAACNISATNMSFGNYSNAAGNTATSNITVTCLASTPYTITLDAGLHGILNGAATSRFMANGNGATLAYNLYLDSGLTTVWANGTSNSASGTASPSTTTTVYGSVPAAQSSPPGSYADTITATLNY